MTDQHKTTGCHRCGGTGWVESDQGCGVWGRFACYVCNYGGKVVDPKLKTTPAPWLAEQIATAADEVASWPAEKREQMVEWAGRPR